MWRSNDTVAKCRNNWHANGHAPGRSPLSQPANVPTRVSPTWHRCSTSNATTSRINTHGRRDVVEKGIPQPFELTAAAPH